MAEVLNKLNDPDTSSSLFPLLVVTGILSFTFLAVLFAAAIKAARLMRSARQQRRARSDGPKPSSTHPTGKLQNFFSLLFSPVEEPREIAHDEERDRLRMVVERLESENLSTKELYAEAQRKIEELEEELSRTKRQGKEDMKRLDQEIQRREKTETRVEQLETQLRDIIAEVEKIYQQNVNVASIEEVNSKLGRVFNESGMEPLPPVTTSNTRSNEASRLKEQAAEIQQLKTVLAQCRQRMVEMASNQALKPESTGKK